LAARAADHRDDPRRVSAAVRAPDSAAGPPGARWRRGGTRASRGCQMARLGSPEMIVFANRRIGPAAELLVSPAVAASMLRATAEAARPEAAARWEHELVRWLEARAIQP